MSHKGFTILKSKLNRSITHHPGSQNHHGFTIVELLIVIVVIGILALISVFAFNGIQKRALTSGIQSDLRNASVAMEMARAETGEYPGTLPPNLRTSPNVTLTLKGSGSADSVYNNLTPVQNGLLFFNLCQTLLAEGVGAKPDDNHDYISSCEVFSKNQIQVNGWNGRTISTPLATTSLATYVNSYTGGSIPEFRLRAQAFMDQLSSRFLASGGQFPIASFWDSWATPQNGGVMKPTLPTPTTVPSDPHTYCIEGGTTSTTGLWHISKNGTPATGGC